MCVVQFSVLSFFSVYLSFSLSQLSLSLCLFSQHLKATLQNTKISKIIQHISREGANQPAHALHSQYILKSITISINAMHTMYSTKLLGLSVCVWYKLKSSDDDAWNNWSPPKHTHKHTEIQIHTHNSRRIFISAFDLALVKEQVLWMFFEYAHNIQNQHSKNK